MNFIFETSQIIHSGRASGLVILLIIAFAAIYYYTVKVKLSKKP